MKAIATSMWTNAHSKRRAYRLHWPDGTVGDCRNWDDVLATVAFSWHIKPNRVEILQ